MEDMAGPTETANIASHQLKDFVQSHSIIHLTEKFSKMRGKYHAFRPTNVYLPNRSLVAAHMLSRSSFSHHRYQTGEIAHLSRSDPLLTHHLRLSGFHDWQCRSALSHQCRSSISRHRDRTREMPNFSRPHPLLACPDCPIDRPCRSGLRRH